jgi:anti-sigma regulatory factor (Ser/Thr protein kinase)
VTSVGEHTADTALETPGAPPRAPLGHLSRLGFALRNATNLDDVARSLLRDLISLPGVHRVGFALAEGGGRRLRFVAGDHVDDGPIRWCHIDAYDDVPLTAVVRTGEPVLGGLDDLEQRFAGIVARWREESTQAVAAWPLPGNGSPLGALLLRYDTEQSFPETQRRLLEAAARRTSDAVRRVRGADREADGAWELTEETAPGERASMLLAGDPRSAGSARRFLRDALAEWGVDDDASDNAQLCLSELVTNVIMHASTTCELSVRLEDDVLTVVVRDLGGSERAGAAWLPADGEDDPLQVYGRGLMLVDALADRWGSDLDAVGTTAWFALELDSSSADSTRTG